ncbi:transposase [Candidatus Binatia bacterium]|nr:transposase [Candidatus Binatia bacterium]
MARAHRIHVPGHVRHLTHRCHNRRFLLKPARDRHVWRAWLSEARRRFGPCVLDYAVTANHVHLLVRDRGQDEIPASMQLVQGRTGQAYKRRKRRRGAFGLNQIGVGIGIGIEEDMSFGHERLDVYRAAIEYVGWVQRTTDRFRCRYRFRPRGELVAREMPNRRLRVLGTTGPSGQAGSVPVRRRLVRFGVMGESVPSSPTATATSSATGPPPMDAIPPPKLPP